MKCVVLFFLFLCLSCIPSAFAQAQQCTSGCYTQQSADMRQCAAAYGPQDKQNCRAAASERAAACIRTCNQGDSQQDREPTKRRPEPRTH